MNPLKFDSNDTMIKALPFILGMTIWLSRPCEGQDYSLKTTKSTFTIEETNFEGYQTVFSLSLKVVKKAWWKYIKGKAVLFNKKTHYELTIAPEKGKSNTALKFISQLEEHENGNQVTLRVAPIKGKMSSTQTKNAATELNVLIKHFKITYFTQEIQAQIDEAEKSSLAFSSKMERYYTQNEFLVKKNKKQPNSKTRSKMNQNKLKLAELQTSLSKEETREINSLQV